MENNFEERRKDVDASNVDIDAHSYQRKKFELDYNFERQMEREDSFYTKELELANNNDDELYRRTKVAAINNDHMNRVKRYEEEYEKNLAEIREKYEPSYTKPNYFKWLYVGPVKKYDNPETGKNIICYLSYYVKLDEFDNLFVYNDAKFTEYIMKIKYIPEEWRELK